MTDSPEAFWFQAREIVTKHAVRFRVSHAELGESDWSWSVNFTRTSIECKPHGDLRLKEVQWCEFSGMKSEVKAKLRELGAEWVEVDGNVRVVNPFFEAAPP